MLVISDVASAAAADADGDNISSILAGEGRCVIGVLVVVIGNDDDAHEISNYSALSRTVFVY